MAQSTIRRLLLVTEPDGTFGSSFQTWLRPDLDRIAGLLADAGFATERVRIDELLDFPFREGDFAFYTSAFNDELRDYVRDVIHFARERVPIAPSYELLLAHENKGVQEILKSKYGLGDPVGFYGVDFDDRRMKPPYVFKTAAGAGSAGVTLVRSAADESRVRTRYFRTSLVRRLKLLQRRQKLGAGDHFRRYAYFYKSFRRYVTQAFVDGLEGDVKVLVFGDRFYTLARSNRPGDFRASGSGRFDFDVPCSTRLLDFARDVAKCFDTPFISLDVAEKDENCFLIEFQALNFGPLTATGSNGFYVERDAGWERVTAPGDLEDAFAHGIAHYVAQLAST